MTPTKDFKTRYAAAKRYRDTERPFIEEVFSFICPGREHDFSNQYSNAARSDENETFLSLPEDLSMDFASDLVTYYTPKETKWTEYEVTVPIPEEAAKIVKAQVEEREQALYDMVQASNYNDVATEIAMEANHGTMAMWVQKGHLTQPTYVENVPPHELLITPGYMGIQDRFRETMAMAEHLSALFDGWDVDLSHPDLQKKVKKPGEKVKVCWGFWVSWEDPALPVWKCEITVDNKRVTPSDHLDLGPLAGACPLLVGRFNPRSGRPWGRGPGRKCLEDLRVMNAINEAVLNGLDQSLMNTLIYADDGFMDFSEGMEPGRAYPASRGFTREQIYELNRGVNLDMGLLSEDRLEERLRAGFYQDGPRQRGDTPPTATQVIDERRRVQIRLAKPSAPLWTEFYKPFIQRLEFIGVEEGRLQGQMTHNGEVIQLNPMSPLQKAQNQDKVLTTRSNLELGSGVFGPEVMPQVVNMRATYQNVVEASGDELTVIQEEQNEPAAPPEPAGPPA